VGSTVTAASTLAVSGVGPRFTPEELRRRLGIGYDFSPEQLDIIAAPADEPLLVVAGAGSGKTELMALRVMWLIANAYVRPDQVLGLTFTRKAAGELSHRIRLYLGRAKLLLGEDAQLAGEPTVATYHSFAARVVREHGMRSGYEPTVRLLTEAACWQLADAAVRQHDSPAMRAYPLGQANATAAVLHLAGELAEHLRDPDDVEWFTFDLTSSVERISGPKVLKPVQDVLDRQKGRGALLPLVREYAARKAAMEAMDFGDQLRRAATVARDHAEVTAAESDRFRVVLLDEYQDTSHAQVVLLQSLFAAGHPVTAVGDPCQSIYGWRGASAGTLDRFTRDFPLGSGAPSAIRSLTVSWRNAPQILEVANRISDPLRGGGAPVKPLRAAATYRPRLAGPPVRCAYTMTYLDEAAWLADSVDAAWREWAGSVASAGSAGGHRGRPTTAVLVRVRAQIPAIERALRERGLPVEVVGLGGLLDTPEVRDVVSTLDVLADPTAGAALLRLLTGARWRIGPRDVVALYRRARRLAWERRQAPAADAAPNGGIEEPDLGGERLDDALIADALDDLGPPDRYSAEGYRRLALVRDELRALRDRLDQSLPDLVADVAQTIGLDVEVAVRGAAGPNGNGANGSNGNGANGPNGNGANGPNGNGRQGGNGQGLARAHLDAIGDVAARFASESEGGTLSAFLAYLAAAEEEERGLTPGEVEVVEGAVQILTVHSAKGLEWDVVAVGGLNADAFPARPKASDHWLKGMGVLPFPLRGDADGLPSLMLDNAGNGRGVREAIEAFDDQWRAHQEREERRLAYVAVTRPRHLLLCSGSRWGDGLVEPREASVFLTEVAETCAAGAGVVDVWVPPRADDETNPTLEHEVSAIWPSDPLGERRPAIVEGADLVRAAAAHGIAESPDLAGEHLERARRWEVEAALLLAERDRGRATGTIDVPLPEHLSVSQLVALQRDPQRLARRLRRPLPEAPDPYARRGTAFHLWLEHRLTGGTGGGALLDIDDLPGAGDAGAAPDSELEELQKAFLESEWVDRVPYRVEVPFATVVAGVVVRGRMDAVFDVPGRPGHYDVIDWKTGQRPTGADATAAAVQLAAYRLAWAELAGVPVSQVGAGFHYVRDRATVRPADLLDQAALVALVAGLPTADR
jgi:DNA helicase-2/ATP-dependent DNA helicase PcrA